MKLYAAVCALAALTLCCQHTPAALAKPTTGGVAMRHVVPSPLVRRSDSPYSSDMGLTDDEDAISIASGDGEPRLPVTENAAVAVARDRIMPLLLNQNVRYAVEEFDRCYTFILLVNAPATFQPAHHRYLLRLMDKVQTATYPANLPYITSYLLRLVIDAGNKRNYPAQQFLMIASAMIQNAYPELESMMNNIPMYEQAANADWIAVSSPRTA